MPCNFHLRRLAERVKDGVRAAGGTPMEFNTVAISRRHHDGHRGHAFLAREPRGDRRLDRARRARAHVRRPGRAVGLRQDDPGLRDGARPASTCPSLMLYGGSIAPGRWRGKDVTIQEVFEGIGAHAAGDLSTRSCPTSRTTPARAPGACGGQFTANTMAMAFEVLGISPMGSSMVPAEDGKKGQVAEDCGRLVVEMLERGITPEPGDHPRVARERDRGRRDVGRLDQPRAAPARRGPRGGGRASIEDFDRIAWGTPLLCDLKPGGRYVATDLYRAGGVPRGDPAPPGGRPAPRRAAHGHRPDDRRGGRPRPRRPRARTWSARCPIR